MDIDIIEPTIEAPAPGEQVVVGSAVAGEAADQIVVKGTYLAPTIDSATRTPTPLLDVPQSVSIVSEQQIEDQVLRDVAEVLRFTPGATPAQGEGHRDQVIIRGQNTTANFFIDGLRDDVQYFRPLYNLERVEILKGANALAFGRGAGGGVINRVTKTARLGEAFTEVAASVDTFGSAFTTADANVSVGDDVALRVNAFYETLDNHRDAFGGDRYAVNPTLGFEPSAATRLDLSYEYVFDDRVVDRGVPSTEAGEPLRGVRDAFFGDRDANRTELEAHILRASARHELSANATLTAALQYADYNKAYRNVYPAGFEGGVVTLDGYFDRTDRENLLGRVELVAQAATGPVSHTLLFGIEGADQATDNDRRDVLFGRTDDDRVDVPLTDPIVVPSFGFPAFGRDRASDVSNLSAYVQDQASLGPVQLVAGLRYDRFEIDVLDRVAAAGDDTDGRLSRTDEEVSPRLGLVYKPAENASLYASYAKSFLPRSGDQFLTLDPTSETLGPEVFETYEVGAKWDLRPRLTLTAAIFEIVRDAGTTVDPDDPERTILIGTETRGAEIQLSGAVTDRLSLNAGYAYLDAQEDGRVVAGEDADRPLPQVPEHQASVWSRFAVTDRLAFGLGATHQSSQLTSLSGEVRLPSFTRVDAAAYYALTDGVTVQLNVENAGDTRYFPVAHNDDNISTGAPLNARFTVRADF